MNEAGFDYGEAVIYIKKNPALADLYHESYHADQFIGLSRDKTRYEELGRLAREEYVYEQVIKNKKLLNDAELRTAEKYITSLRRQLGG